MRTNTQKQDHQITTLLFIIIFITSMALHSQPNDIRFRHLTIEHGLSQNTPMSINQDAKGFIWIGTQAGLNKYDGYNFTVYKTDIFDSTSISCDATLSMYKDHSGVLWIGTDYGLNRYNSSNNIFIRYLHDVNNPNSISHDRVYSICEDSNNGLWIGTTNGLNSLNQERNSFIRYFKDPDNPNSLSSNDARVVYADRAGSIWIGTYGGGLNRFDPDTKQFKHFTYDRDAPNSLSDNYVRAIYEDRKGVLWIGTENGGLNKFDRGSEQFTCYKTDPHDPYSLNDNRVNVIYEDNSGRLWIGTSVGGVSIFNRETEKCISFQNDPDNPNSLRNNQIQSICEDNTGDIWIGTNGRGVSIYNQETEKFILYEHSRQNSNSLSNNLVLEIFEDRFGILWIGTYYGGLNRFDRKRNIFTHYKHDKKNPHSITSNVVSRIYEDKSGVLWIGTDEGLDKFIRETERFIHYKSDPDNPQSISSNKIRCIYEDHLGTLWIGTRGGGLNRLDRRTGHFTHYKHNPDDSTSISNDRVYCLYEDNSSNFWVGTLGGGLNKFDRETGHCIRYVPDSKNINSLSNSFVAAIHEDIYGNLWIGTLGGGLNKFNRVKETFTHYTEKDGLSNNEVYAILEDDKGNLWLSTNRGLSKFNPKTETFKTYSSEDGLQSNEFNIFSACRSQSGEMFFGGTNGFNAFFPDSTIDNPFPPSIVITGFKLSNKPVPIGQMADGRTILEKSIAETEEVTLSYRDKVISFEFAALHYVAPDKNQYAYMMEGLEKEWNYVASNSRFVTYSGLSPGKYVFKVNGANKDGLWNEDGTSLKITIVPPFWKTWWFYLLCLVTFVLFVTALFIYQINRIKKQKEEEQRQKILKDFSHILQHGKATVYRRNAGSDTYEHIGEGIKDITGYDANKFTVSFWKEIIISAEIEGDLSRLTVKEAFKRLKEGSIKSFVLDNSFHDKSGKIRWIRDIPTGLYDKSGKCYAFLGIVFDITDRKLAEQGLAKANHEMESDLNMAREVQMTFLEKQPRQFPENVPTGKSSLQFHHRYIPTTTLAGDFFNIIPISNNKVGIFVCDVMGHGARASLLTAYLQGLIGEIMPFATDPGAFLKKLNLGINTIMYQFTQGIFATAFYLVADIKTGRIQYTNAGHPRPLVLRRSQEIVENLYIPNSNAEPALGFLEDFEYSVFEGAIKKDDIILLYTDGVYEVDNKDGEIFGQKRLLNSSQNLLLKHPDQLLDGILHDMTSFAKNDVFSDDVCMLTMHVKDI